MSKQKLTALLTALALVLGLCGASVLAAPDSGEADTSQSASSGASSGGEADISAPEGEEVPASSEKRPQAPDASGTEDPAAGTEEPGQYADAAPDGSGAGDASAEGADPEGSEGAEDGGEDGTGGVPELPAPDPVGTISFANLGSRMRANSFSLLALEENIAAVESLDYEKMTEEIRDSINELAEMQWMLIVMGQSMAAQSLQAQYDALRDTFDDLKEGKLQQDNADIVRQLRNTQDQLVITGEFLYIALAEMEMNDKSLQRSLTALDRTVREMELRYDLGQVSALQLQETRSGRTSMASGKETLETNIRSMKYQLEMLLGAELTGNIQLQGLPQVTNAELEAMDQETDLAAAKAASWTLYDAGLTLKDAEQAYKDAGKQYSYNEKKYQFLQAKHTWQAAQYTYQATVQNYENSFRTLYLQVKDYKQVLDAARTSLAVEKANLEATQLKYDQGTVSQNTLLTAQDDVATAQEKVDGAAIDLFSAYHNYRWAVDYGILN